MVSRVPTVVFVSGSGSNGEAVMAAASAGFCAAQVVAVVSDQAKASGLVRARRRGVPALPIPVAGRDRAEHERAVLEAIKPYAPRLAVLAGYMRLVTPLLLDHFSAGDRLGVLNIHPADTRAYQGVHGYEFAMGLTPQSAERLEQTWITTHFVDAGMDTGAIISQAPVPISTRDSLDDVKTRGLAVEHQLYPRVVDAVAREKVSLVDGQLRRDPALNLPLPIAQR